MAKYVNTPDYRHGSQAVTGVLLTNLGTPDAPTASALRRYLGQFLADPRVVEVPRLLWMIILHGVILNIRPRRSAHAYQQVWTDEGSPLLSFSRKQAAAIEQALENSNYGPIKVELAMRYGSPSIESALTRLHQANARRLLVLPLYPQYSASTCASTFDAVADVLKSWRWVPQFRMIMDYHRHESWIQAVADSISEHWEQNGHSEKLVMSFHGLPERYLKNGDPYHCQCHASARLVAEKLQIPDDAWQVVFQSRFGREEWLKPYCDETLESLGKSGIKKVDIICPGFSADCLETLEEVAMQNRDIFLAAGGQQYAYIPALNDRADHIQSLVELIEKNLQGWEPDQTDSDRELARQRALAMGATQ
jgi:ferrochelatase